MDIHNYQDDSADYQRLSRQLYTLTKIIKMIIQSINIHNYKIMIQINKNYQDTNTEYQHQQ